MHLLLTTLTITTLGLASNELSLRDLPSEQLAITNPTHLALGESLSALSLHDTKLSTNEAELPIDLLAPTSRLSLHDLHLNSGLDNLNGLHLDLHLNTALSLA